MPVPVIPIVIAVPTFLGPLVAWYVVRKLRGSRIAVFGDRGVGKTTLGTYLETGHLPHTPKQTVVTNTSKKVRFTLDALKLQIYQLHDPPGGKSAYGVWDDLFSQVDFVLYLLRADQMAHEDSAAVARVRDDCRQFQSWRERAKREKKKTPRRIIIVGTHCDQDGKFCDVDDSTIGSYVDDFRKLPIINEAIGLCGGDSSVGLVLGSMKDEESAEQLVRRLIHELAR